MFRRADSGEWQGIAGGVEEGETLDAAARREAQEEGGIPLDRALYRLQTMNTVPVTCIRAELRVHWPPKLLVMPNYAFALEAGGVELALSTEHTEVVWLPYAEARARLSFPMNQLALWELQERLQQGLMLPPLPH